ncbi:monocarboxylate transporter 3-like [Phymastichus coffea]|uniref:monocarboxylate transporter 3-like n=1 Tax=Phymastichus coffea TaxID=108790 RepID=UPI00273CE775|nr:monocarboxylate transporter 3-like [Phymastichus coffea]
MTALGLDKRMRLAAPDGGWGWVVLAAALVVNVLIPGTAKSFGVLFVEFVRVFEASPTQAAWIPALCYFLYSSLGPLSSVLSTKYSYRSVSLVGGLFASSGLMLSYLANSVTYLYFSYGIMFGIGAGLCFPVTIYIVSEYFDRLRGLATGITISGSCIGSVILPPLLQWMIQQFGYRTAVLIMGGVLLNTVAVALLYHPVERHMRLVADDEPDKRRSRQPAGVDKESAVEAQPPAPASYLASHRSSIVSMVGCVTLDPRRGSRISLSRRLASKQHQSALEDAAAAAAAAAAGGKEAPAAPAAPEAASEERADDERVEGAEPVVDCLGQLSILRDPLYLVILVSNAASSITNTNFMILLPAYALSRGHSVDSSALLLSVVSLLDLVGRCGGAALSDMNFMPKHYYFVAGLGLSGLALSLLPVAAVGYAQLAALCALFGLASGLYIGTTAVVLADMLGPERLTASYGISLFVNGVCQLAGPPLCNLAYERLGSYQAIFTALGLVSVAGTCLWSMLPLIRRLKRRQPASPA